jgi:hypothetical protein
VTHELCEFLVASTGVDKPLRGGMSQVLAVVQKRGIMGMARGFE